MFSNHRSGPEWDRRARRIESGAIRPKDPTKSGRERLARLLKHARESVPFYLEHFGRQTDLFVDDLPGFPVVGNQEIHANLSEFTSVDYEAGIITVTQSSGTTALPLPHIKSVDDEYVANWALRRRLENDFSLPASSDVIDLAPRFQSASGRLAEPLASHEPVGSNRLTWRLPRFDTVASQDDDLRNLIAQIATRDTAYIYGAPSRIDGFMRFCVRQNLRLRFHLIVSGFEDLSDDMRETFEAFFDCKVINLYGLNECGLIAWECPFQNGLHVQSDYAHVEILELDSDKRVCDGETGRLVVTSLKSWLMPIIRYDTGDIARLQSGDCECGNSGISILAMEGRVSAMLVCANGDRIGPTLVSRHLKDLGLTKYQIRQADPGRIIVNIGPKTGAGQTDSISERLNDQLRKSQLQIEASVESADFEIARSGKFHAVLPLSSSPRN